MSGEYDVNLRYGVDTTMNLAGKVAVVTGGLGGITMATNGMLLEKGASLALLYPPFEAEKVASLRADFPVERVQFVCCDVTEPTRQAEISYAVFCLKKKKNSKKA